jgi:vancomycin aglycone glucosyltransferase
MNVLLAGVGTRGDLQPLVALAHRLRALGHDARLAGSETGRSAAQAAGVDLLPIGPDVPTMMRVAGAVDDRPLATMRLLARIVRETMDAQFAVLEPHLAWADVLVAGGLVLAAPALAERAGIPLRMVSYAGHLLQSRNNPSPWTPALGLPGWANAASWWAYGRVYSAMIQGPSNAHRERLGLRRTRALHHPMFPAGSLFLAADPELSPPPGRRVPTSVQTGPWFLPEEGHLPPAAQAFLDAGSTPVYLGFGSMPAADAARITRLVVDAVEKAGVRALLSAGAAGLGAAGPGAAGPGASDLPDTCLALGDCPHSALFPRVAGVVHHGGAGTTHEAARAGVPQLVIPHLLDQHG